MSACHHCHVNTLAISGETLLVSSVLLASPTSRLESIVRLLVLTASH